jgi:hypothetical protein
MIGIAALIGFISTIPAANWLIGNVGTCVPNGPCLVPVGFGLMAPSGVLMIGLALVLRDIVHRELGAKAALAAICLGSGISAYISPPALVIASIVPLPCRSWQTLPSISHFTAGGSRQRCFCRA